MSDDRPHRLSDEALEDLLRDGVGLVLGPGSTHRRGLLARLSIQLQSSLELEPQSNYLHLGDQALNQGISELRLKNEIARYLKSQEPLRTLHRLASIRWAGVLSACLDSSFDEEFRQASERHPVRRAVTVVSDLSAATPPRTTPVFKLLGSLATDDFASSSTSYLIRRGTWHAAISSFSDAVKGRALLCLGFDELDWLLKDLLGQMLARPQSVPRRIVFTADDPVTEEPGVRRLLAARNLLSLAGTREELLRIAGQASLAGPRQAALPLGPRESRLQDELKRYEDLAIPVNCHLETELQKNDRNVLLDLLFSPSKPRWDPFLHDLDFPRSAVNAFLLELRQRIDQGSYLPAACVLRGGAAAGKTTALKRMALDLARDEHLVIWLRPWYFQDTQGVLRTLFRSLSPFGSDFGDVVIVIMDDPLQFTGITPTDVVDAASDAGLQIVLLVAVRSSDWELTDGTLPHVGPLPIVVEEMLPERFSEEEQAALPGYLCSLGITSTLEQARHTVREVAGRSANDVLSTLYWLVPETRQSIRDSIRDEYFRLGNVSGLRTILLAQIEGAPDLVRRAYEFTAVAARYGAALPIEVLVAGLNVSYEDWLSATREGDRTWGLLYSERLPNSEGTAYRTRNDVVTRVLLDLVNGGTVGHAGELSLLTRLFDACTGTQPVYREFCMRIMANRDGLKHLDFREGLRLYESVEQALPFPDKTLVHHKGLWVKNRGSDPIEAERVLKLALDTPVYPYATRRESNEHIFTSLAATAVDKIDAKLVAIEEGKREVFGFLEKARHGLVVLNPNALHVETGLVVRLLERTSPNDPDALSIAARTLNALDGVTLVAGEASSILGPDELRLLEQARSRILSKIATLEELKVLAEEAWDSHQRQDLFVVVGRILYGEARSSLKGRLFRDALAYLEEARCRVLKAGTPVSTSLDELAAQVYYHWRIRRSRRGSSDPIDWEKLLLLAREALASASRRSEPLLCYIEGLSLCHLDRWQEAGAVFAQLRSSGLANRILHLPRDFLLADDHSPRILQGKVVMGGSRCFLKMEGSVGDIVARRRDDWPLDGETAFARVQFSCAGPLAVRS